MPLFTTGNSERDAAAANLAGSLFGDLARRFIPKQQTVTPAGSLSRDARANIVAGGPASAATPPPAQPWYRKPIVMIGGAVALGVILLVTLRRKRR